MANPVEVTVAKDAWTKVATNVTTGTIRVLKRGAHMLLQTYRTTGAAVPVNRSEGAVISGHQIDIPIAAAAAIDVYLWIDGVAGIVRVDL